MRMRLKRVVFAVFQDEDAFGNQQIVLEDEVGQGGELLKCVGRVGKDKIELLVTGFQESKNVATDEQVVVRSNFLHALSGCQCRRRGRER